MTQETKLIEIPIYRDSNGNPICGGDKICMFGTWYDCYQCVLDNGEVEYNHCNPHKNCPLWQGELE